MIGSRFDTLTRWTAQPTTRRAAVAGTGAGLAAVALGTAGFGGAAMAQDATPAATPGTVTDVSLLFVQHAGPSTLVPGEGGVHILTLGEVTAQTLYFSDRPNRIAGTEPTESFAAQFNQAFSDSPPNATLIGHLGRGAVEEEAVVVTLLSAVYDAAAATLTYEVTLLDAERITDRTFEREPLTVLDAPREYAEVSLFIDDLESCLLCLLTTISAPFCMLLTC